MEIEVIKWPFKLLLKAVFLALIMPAFASPNPDGSATTQTRYTRDEILRSGFHTTAEFLRQLPLNSFGSPRPGSGVLSQVDTAIDLRGLGASRTLVLIDGRRLPKSSNSAAWPNIELIPLNAIERIEVMTSGDAASYGNDAVSGVINIISRKNYQGMELMLSNGEASIPSRGGEYEAGTLTVGSSAEQIAVMAGITWDERSRIIRHDLPWRVPRNGVFGFNFTTLTDDQDDLNFTVLPNSCDGLSPAFNLVPSIGSIDNRGRCAYDSTLVFADEPEIENKSLFAHTTYQLNQRWQLHANNRYIRHNSQQQSAPVGYSSFYLIQPLSSSSPNNPTNPNSPFYDPTLNLDSQPINWWHVFDALGNRTKVNQAELLDLGFTVEGQLTNSTIKLGWQSSNQSTQQVSRNNLLHEAALASIESGSFSLFRPYDSGDAELNVLQVTSIREGQFNQTEWYANFSYSGIELPAGQLKLQTGITLRTEKYQDIYDPLTLASQITGGFVNVHNRSAKQDITETYVLADIPVFKQTNLALGFRHADNSRFKSTTAEKIAISYQPFQSFQLFAAYSKDYSFPNLYQAPDESFTQHQAIFFGPICFQQPQESSCFLNDMIVIDQFNRSLAAETTNNYSVGINFQPNEHFQLKANYIDSTVNDTIRYFEPELVALTTVIPELTLPVEMGCQSGTCIVGYGNLGQQFSRSLIFDMLYQGSIAGGNYESRWQSVHTFEDRYLGVQPIDAPYGGFLNRYIEDDGNQIGTLNKPKHRAQWQHSYSLKNWQFTYQLNLIGKQDELSYTVLKAAPTWVTHDLQVQFHSNWDAVLTLGFHNLAAKKPPLDQERFTFRRYQTQLYNPFGRIIYFRYQQSF